MYELAATLPNPAQGADSIADMVANLVTWTARARDSRRIRLTALALRSFFMNPDIVRSREQLRDVVGVTGWGVGDVEPANRSKPERARTKFGTEGSTFGNPRGYWAAALELKFVIS